MGKNRGGTFSTESAVSGRSQQATTCRFLHSSCGRLERSAHRYSVDGIRFGSQQAKNWLDAIDDLMNNSAFVRTQGYRVAIEVARFVELNNSFIIIRLQSDSTLISAPFEVPEKANKVSAPRKTCLLAGFSFWYSVVFVPATGRRFPLRPRMNITGQCYRLKAD